MGRQFRVENPFLWETKAEVIARIAAAGCPDLVEPSSSCSRVIEMTNIHSHCGKCSQCIDRRFAALASGNEAYDPKFRYKVDLLEGARETLEDRTMVVSYISTATEMDKMTEMDFFSRFGGEISRVLSHIDGTSDENATKIWDLYKRHARQVCAVIDNAIQNHVREIREGTLPASCLIILALAEEYRRSAWMPLADMDKSHNIFRKEGDVWRIIYDGKQLSLKDAKGLNYIAYLLRYPGKEFPVLILRQQIEGTPPIEKAEIYQKMDKEKLAAEGLSISGFGDAGEVIDDEARAEYYRQIRELEKEIVEAEENNDFAGAARARSKKESLEEHLLAASGLMGRTRKFYNPSERARISVTNRINDSRRKIQRTHPELGQHLRNFIKTGFSCSYKPDKSTPWET
jgi:hypothetical protein